MLLQLQLFEEHQSNDEEALPGTRGIDLSSPLDIFHAILKQVSTSLAQAGCLLVQVYTERDRQRGGDKLVHYYTRLQI